MDTGTKISAVAHLGLVAAALFGGVFRSEPLPFEVQDVSVITAEQFAAMTASAPAPVAAPVAPTPPEQDVSETAVPAPETAPETPQPDTVAPPESEDTPEAVTQPSSPDPELSAQTPQPVPPQEQAEIVPLPPAQRPQPRPAERVAPEPVSAPPPEARPDDQEQLEIAPAPGAQEPQPEQEATAPEEAGTAIETEANQEDEPVVVGAPSVSPRPPVRPARPEPQTQPETASAPSIPSSTTSDAVNDALAEALGGSQSAPAGGGAIDSSEIAAIKAAVGREWRVDAGGLSSNVIVTVGFELTREGKLASSPRLVASEGGSGAAVDAAFRKARTAIIAASRKGAFDLPPEKYNQWKSVEMVFNPEKMRTR